MKNRRQVLMIFMGLIGLSQLAFGQGRNNRLRPERVRDPVCGIAVEKNPQLSAEYRGRVYFFCSNADKNKFRDNPQEYLG
jgi:P-type Cu+ transporter